jgi:hypothetical protein
MLDDGSPHQPIAQWLATQGHPEISERNISTWRHSGFVDWIHSQETLRDLAGLREFAGDINRKQRDTKLQQAALHLGTARVLRQLRDFDPEAYRTFAAANPQHLNALLLSLARLNHQHLKLQKYKDEQRDKNRKVKPPIPYEVPTEAIKAAEEALHLF